VYHVYYLIFIFIGEKTYNKYLWSMVK